VVSVTAGPGEGRLRRWACRRVCARRGQRWWRNGPGRLPATAVRLPGSPTPEPSPSPASRSTRARQPRPVRCGHPATCRCQSHGLLFTIVHGWDRQDPRRAVRARL